MIRFWNDLALFPSEAAVEIDGTRPLIIHRSFIERYLSWPWMPWITTKTIQIPNYKPIMIRIGFRLYYHPSLETQLLKAVRNSAQAM